MLRAPNWDRAPNPRTEMRVSCDGFVRFATVTPGSSESVWSTFMWNCPGASESGRRFVMPYGRSSGDRPTSRVTVTTGGSLRGSESCAAATRPAASAIPTAYPGQWRTLTNPDDDDANLRRGTRPLHRARDKHRVNSWSWPHTTRRRPSRSVGAEARTARSHSPHFAPTRRWRSWRFSRRSRWGTTESASTACGDPFFARRHARPACRCRRSCSSRGARTSTTIGRCRTPSRRCGTRIPG